uniref:Uncharacterized protein n=1 Tax=Opuntia streptacantha TaxID=393608 RepID=A0A7C9E5T7_OPUST
MKNHSYTVHGGFGMRRLHWNCWTQHLERSFRQMRWPSASILVFCVSKKMHLKDQEWQLLLLHLVVIPSSFLRLQRLISSLLVHLKALVKVKLIKEPCHFQQHRMSRLWILDNFEIRIHECTGSCHLSSFGGKGSHKSLWRWGFVPSS